jgi:hypothetical protein
MLESALFGGLHIPVDAADRLVHGGEGVGLEHLPGGGGDLDQFAVLQEDHVAGVGQKGRDVRAQEVFARAHAHHQRAGHAGGPEGAGVVGAHHHDGVGSLHQGKRLGDGAGHIAANVLQTVGDEVDQHFGIGVGAELHAFLGECGRDFLVVRDDAVVDEGQSARVVQVRVGVPFHRGAVGGPARVPPCRRWR